MVQAAPPPCLELDIATGLPFDAEIDLGGIDLSDLSVVFPVGSLSIGGPGIPNPGDVVGKLLASANAALMPFIPLFDLIDAILSIKVVLDAVVSLKPPKITAAIDKLVMKLDRLKKLLPQFSVPCLLKSLVTAVLVYLVGMRAELKAIIDAQARIDLATTQAVELGSPLLAQMAACAQANLTVQFSSMKRNGKPLNRLIAILNQLASMVGLPQVPIVADLGSNAQAALAPIDAAIQAVTNLRNAIPC